MFKTYWISLLLLTTMQLTGQAGEELVPDGMIMIPGGTYYIGSNDHQEIAAPKHPVTVAPFYMDIYEVSNKEYYEFCMATGHKLPEFWGMEIYKSGLDYPDHPVVGVGNFNATEYAEWVGKRLPTEAEWEIAARGGVEDISFSYGEEADHDFARFNDPIAEKGPVKRGSYPPNGYGLYDMNGNVWEWVSDWFSEVYYQESPEANPSGPSHGTFRVFRGGGWHSGGGCTAVHHRNALPSHWVDIAGGFRCAKDNSETAKN